MKKIMDNLLYIIAFFMIVLWAMGYFIFNAFWIIHLLLIIGLIAVIIKVVRSSKV